MAWLQNKLATGVSKEVKSQQSRLPKMACDTKQKLFNEKFIFELNHTDRMFFKNFLFPQSDIMDTELQHLPRVSVENIDVFSKMPHDAENVTQKFPVKLKKDAEIRKQRPSKVALPYRNPEEVLLN